MTGLLAALLSAPAERILFVSDGVAINAGQVRAAARAAADRIGATEGQVFLHTESAALLCAGLLAGAELGRTIAVLPHAQPAYLDEIGAAPDVRLMDRGETPSLVLPASGDARLDHAAKGDPQLVFFTSGSTGAPKLAPKLMSQVDAEASLWVDWFAGKADHVCGSVSHQHIYGLLFRVAVPVMSGWTSTDRQAFAWEAFAAEMGPRSVAVTSPAHLTRIPPGLAAANGAPAFILSSGQALPLAGALDADRLFGAPPVEILGSTETGGVAIRQRRDDAEPWTPLKGVGIRLDDEQVLQVLSPFAGAGEQRMGDRAEILPDGRFRLLARADRVVKIEGKRVSLTRVEAALAGTPGVAEVAALGLGGEGEETLAVVLVLTPEGGSELAKLGAFRFTRALRNSLSEALEPAERPKRWRIVGRMPTNSQGKRVMADLAALFDQGSMLQQLDAEVFVEGETALVRFTLKPDLAFFDGHFPGLPILPGVAQVHMAVRLAEDVWGFQPGNFEVSKMKFRKLMRPAEVIEVKLVRDVARKRLSFWFTANRAPTSEGVVG